MKDLGYITFAVIVLFILIAHSKQITSQTTDSTLTHREVFTQSTIETDTETRPMTIPLDK